jgi:hypothetical protein
MPWLLVLRHELRPTSNWARIWRELGTRGICSGLIRLPRDSDECSLSCKSVFNKRGLRKLHPIPSVAADEFAESYHHTPHPVAL